MFFRSFRFIWLDLFDILVSLKNRRKAFAHKTFNTQLFVMWLLFNKVIFVDGNYIWFVRKYGQAIGRDNIKSLCWQFAIENINGPRLWSNQINTGYNLSLSLYDSLFHLFNANGHWYSERKGISDTISSIEFEFCWLEIVSVAQL